MVVNIFGLAKNSVEAGVHVLSGNQVAATASVIKAGVSCIPVVGHVPGVGHLVDIAIAGESSQITVKENHELLDTLDFNHDGDIDLDDASEILHHIADFFSP